MMLAIWRCLLVAGLTTAASAADPLPPLPWEPAKWLGTSELSEISVNRITPYGCLHPGGVVVDESGPVPRYYVLDAANNRVLGYEGWRPAEDGSSPPADVVIGQPSAWDNGAANGDSTRFLQPTASTLAMLPFPWVSSTLEAPRNVTMDTDPDGNLYLVDLCNNRVLKYNKPFETDTIADDCWGHIDAAGDPVFTERDGRAPSRSSLRNIDHEGNLWVADYGNHRVLCYFPDGDRLADLVLGQPNFNANFPGGGLQQMDEPIAVKRHPITGDVFVLDGEVPGRTRLLRFTEPFSNGMAASAELYRDNNRELGLFSARSLAISPKDPSRVWIADGGNNRILRARYDIESFEIYGLRDADGGRFYSLADGVLEEQSNNSTWPIRQPDAITFDSDGRLYIAQPYRQNLGIARGPLPVVNPNENEPVVAAPEEKPLIVESTMTLPGANQTSARTWLGGVGVVMENNQLILGDVNRILVWDNIDTTASYEPASFALFQDRLDGFDRFIDPIWDMDASAETLFVGYRLDIGMHALPVLQGGLNPPVLRRLHLLNELRWADDLSVVNFSELRGLAYDAANDALFVSDVHHARVLRISDPLGEALVDLVLGQGCRTCTEDNQGEAPQGGQINAKHMIDPNRLILDPSGNLYVVDSAYEGRVDNGGNLRVLRFDAADLQPVPGNPFPNPAATGVFAQPDFMTSFRTNKEENRPHTPIDLAFDSQGRMVMAVDGYDNEQNQRLFFYPTPAVGETPQPTHVIPTTMGQAGDMQFDDQDRLVVTDHTWNRLLFYDMDDLPSAITLDEDVERRVDANVVALALRGSATADLTELRWVRQDGLTGSLTELPQEGGGLRWTAAVPLEPGLNLFQISGVNPRGLMVSTAVSIERAAGELNELPPVRIDWTSIETPEDSGEDAKILGYQNALYFLPGKGSAFYRLDPATGQWTTLANTPFVQIHPQTRSNGLSARGNALFTVLDAGAFVRYDVDQNQWVTLLANSLASHACYAPPGDTVVAPWRSGNRWVRYTPNPPSSELLPFNVDGDNWTGEPFDTTLSGTEVFAVKNDWTAGDAASPADVLFNVNSGDPTITTKLAELPWNPGNGLSLTAMDATQSPTGWQELLVLRGQGINANQDGFGTPTADIATWSPDLSRWRGVTPLPEMMSFGSDMSHVGSEIFVKGHLNRTLWRGRAPDIPNPTLNILQQVEGENAPCVELLSTAGLRYAVDACDDLRQGVWQNIGEKTGTGGVLSFIDLDPQAEQAARRIYRVRVLR